MKNPYEVLGVSVTAPAADIAAAYRKKVPLVHPDRHPEDPRAAEKFMALTAAYEILKDETKRDAYDGSRMRGTGFIFTPPMPGATQTDSVYQDLMNRFSKSLGLDKKLVSLEDLVGKTAKILDAAPLSFFGRLYFSWIRKPMMQLRKQAFIRDQKKHEKEMRTLNADGTCGLWLGPFPGEIYLTRESAGYVSNLLWSIDKKVKLSDSFNATVAQSAKQAYKECSNFNTFMNRATLSRMS